MATLRQLEYLVEVIDRGSFTRAAEALFVTQPALSHQIRALERQTGGPLIERLPHGVRATPMGRAMLPHARAALAAACRATAVARQAGELDAGELEIAAVQSVSFGVLPRVLRQWRKHHPGIRIRVFEHRHANELAAAMAAGRADVAIGPQPVGWRGPVRHVCSMDFVVVTAGDDPLSAVGDRLRLADLAERDWVHYSPDNGLSEVLDTSCAAAGFNPRIAMQTDQTAAVPMMSAAGIGVGLVPVEALAPHYDGRILWPQPPIRRDLYVYARAEPDPMVTAFMDSCATALADPAQ
ncbi:LysR family transcriptional regulator [Nocardia sp. NPDC051030]|uniref:LysR family transcriptional regulator n=1 Tax=Nocardia sp. NPDC051030 TaxID=3155162 RepID=UPI003427317B